MKINGYVNPNIQFKMLLGKYSFHSHIQRRLLKIYAYSEPCQTSKLKCFKKIVDGLKPLNYFCQVLRVKLFDKVVKSPQQEVKYFSNKHLSFEHLKHSYTNNTIYFGNEHPIHKLTFYIIVRYTSK